VFRSADYPRTASLFDEHFVPHTLLQALSYPFWWVRSQSMTSEITFRDIRFAVLILMALGVLGLRLAQRRSQAGTTTPAGRRLTVLFIVAFCLWLYEWSIQRYLVSLELLTGPMALVLLQWSGRFDLARGRSLALASAAVAAMSLLTVRVPDWGHARWPRSWYAVDMPQAAAAASVFILDGEALSYAVPELPPAASVIGIINWENISSWGDTVFARRIHALLNDQPPGAIWAIAGTPALHESFIATIAGYGLKQVGPCQTRPGRPSALTWCPLAPAGSGPQPAG
jgi:hypothetical protein